MHALTMFERLLLRRVCHMKINGATDHAIRVALSLSTAELDRYTKIIVARA